MSLLKAIQQKLYELLDSVADQYIYWQYVGFRKEGKVDPEHTKFAIKHIRWLACPFDNPYVSLSKEERDKFGFPTPQKPELTSSEFVEYYQYVHRMHKVFKDREIS